MRTFYKKLAVFLYQKIGSRQNRGQTAVEYLLMLSSVAAMMIIFGILFHKRLIGAIFTIIGMIIGDAE